MSMIESAVEFKFIFKQSSLTQRDFPPINLLYGGTTVKLTHDHVHKPMQSKKIRGFSKQLRCGYEKHVYTYYIYSAWRVSQYSAYELAPLQAIQLGNESEPL